MSDAPQAGAGSRAPSESDGKSEEAIASFREFREYARGGLDVEHHDVYQWAGLVDDPLVREVLAFMKEQYDPSAAAELLREDLEQEDVEDVDQEERDEGIEERIEELDEMPRRFEETDFFRAAIRKFATETASQAIAEGNVSQTVYLTGLPSYESDISGLHAINQLADWLVHSEQCKLVYLAALMGRGKTDFSLTLLEIIHDHYQRLERAADLDQEVPTPEFAANFDVDAPEGVEVKLIKSYDELVEWAERGDSSEVRWFIFDEASTELTAQSGENSQKVAETMAPFVKKMRKNGINMIVIGHDKRDVHPAIRSMADFVDKVGTKTASFYAGIKKREPTGHLFDVSGIPPTSWEFDTDDTADWSWGSAVEDGEVVVEGYTDDELREIRDERIARLYQQTDVTQEDLASAFQIGQTTVSGACRRFDFANDSEEVTAD